ncbi:Methylglyoxal synthase [compost metagenome]
MLLINSSGFMEIAIIAHDGKKADLINFLIKNSDVLHHEKIKLIGTGTTGGKAEAAGFKTQRITQMVFFFKDPLSSHPHEADINMLIRVCDVHNVPLATNEATAQLLLDAIAQQL